MLTSIHLYFFTVLLNFLPAFPASLSLLQAEGIHLGPCLYFLFPQCLVNILFSLLLEDFFVGFDFQSSKVKVSTSGRSWCITALADLKRVALVAGQYLYDIRRKQEEI